MHEASITGGYASTLDDYAFYLMIFRIHFSINL